MRQKRLFRFIFIRNTQGKIFEIQGCISSNGLSKGLYEQVVLLSQNLARTLEIC